LSYICEKEEVSFEKDALMAIVKNAGGSFRDAESILEKVLGGVGVVKDKKVDFTDVREILGLAESTQIEAFVNNLLNKNLAASLESFSVLAESGVNLFQLTRQSLEYLRELLLQKVCDKEGDFTLRDLLTVITELSSAEARLKYASVARLPIEVAIVSICGSEESSQVNTTDKNVDKNVQAEKKNKSSSKESASLPQKIMSIPRKITNTVKKEKEDPETLSNIKKNWEVLIEKVRPFNHHLSAFFKKATAVKVEGEHLYLSVPYRFHKQRIESAKSQEIFAQALEDVVGRPLKCVCEVTQETSLQEEPSTSVVGANNVVLEVLGDIIE
jgi:DNA polymerase-3 subunit gamma/tau